MHRVLLPFEFAEPTSVGEVMELVDGRKARVLAGGVDLVLKMRLRQVVPEKVVSLQKVPGLDYVQADGAGLQIRCSGHLEADRALTGRAPGLAVAGSGDRLHRLGPDQGDGNGRRQSVRRHPGFGRGAGPLRPRSQGEDRRTRFGARDPYRGVLRRRRQDRRECRTRS